MIQHTKLALAFAFLSMPGLCADWNPRLAAEYLDARQKVWFAWAPASAPGGACVSCHTGLTYLLARPALRLALGESQRTAYETGLLGGLRARLDKPDKKDPHALGVESVLSSLLFTLEDTAGAKLSSEARQAFDRMWSLQIRDGKEQGSWAWFNLTLDPWEMPDSRFYGAALAALATGNTPAEYRELPEIRDRIVALTAYLGREQQSQPLHNRLILLWASTKLPAALPESMRQPLIDEVWQKQQPDGGWMIEALGPWKEHAAAPHSPGSNCYATALSAFVLQRAGVRRSDPKLARALDWLRSHQDPQFGYWAAESMNKKYEPDSVPLQFMRDAATGFAVLALVESGEPAQKRTPRAN